VPFSVFGIRKIINSLPLRRKIASQFSSSAYVRTNVLFICFAISSSAKCLRVSKTESYGLSRICFEMTRQATMPSLSEKCLRVFKTESYGLRRICFEMTRQATMPSSKWWLCLADEQPINLFYPRALEGVLFLLCSCSNSTFGSTSPSAWCVLF
jgi:hypothetical protein